MKKKTRSEAISIAQAARRLPHGFASPRLHLQLPAALATASAAASAKERGAVYSIGALMAADNGEVLRRILDRIGAPVTETFVSPGEVRITCGGDIFRGEYLPRLLADALLMKILDVQG